MAHCLVSARLQVEHADPDGENFDLNMIVPINLLKPILEDVLKIGRANRPPRPWLGLYTADIEDQIVIAGIAADGPSDDTELEVATSSLALVAKRFTTWRPSSEVSGHLVPLA